MDLHLPCLGPGQQSPGQVLATAGLGSNYRLTHQDTLHTHHGLLGLLTACI